MKNRRQALILQAVEQGGIGTQEQLIAYLQKHGAPATQATVSRDIKELGLSKIAGPDGRVRYQAPPTATDLHRQRTVLCSFILSVSGAGNIVCVQCRAGMAQAVCASLDALPPEGVLGSLAGEDTIFLLCRGEAEMRAVREGIKEYVAELNH